ncbi:MAG: alanine--glyoxylate aminotransferase family protein [Bdellovibrionales bacterium]
MEFPYLLMTPGPVRVPNEVLAALSEPMIHHRTPAFEKTLAEVLAKLKKIYATEEPVFIHTSTGSGAMESALVNTLSPGDKVLALVSGKFGERWADIARAYGMQVSEIKIPWGEAASLEAVKAALSAEKFKAVLCQACETSTATQHPIKEIAQLVCQYSETLFLVDAITALGVMELKTDEWGLDVVVGGSQKSLMLPTGLSFISLSKKAQKALEHSKTPRYYWDLRKELKANGTGQTFFSSSVSLIRALDQALTLILKNGLEANITEFARLSRGLRAGGESLGFKTFSKAPSPSVTAFLVPGMMDSEKLRDLLESKYNLTLMGGQDQLRGKILRVGTLGYVRAEEIRETLRRLALGLQEMGHPCDATLALSAFEKAYKGHS